MNFKLAIVVLTWKDWKNTLFCLKSIQNQNFKNFKVFIVDNNSKDLTFFKIQQWSKKNKLKFFDSRKKKLKVIDIQSFDYFFLENEKNLGCGLGHNIGYKNAIKFNFDYVARIDNDMVMPKKFLGNLVKILEGNSHIQAISPKIMYKFEKNKIWWRGTKIGNGLKFQKHLRDYPYGELDNIKLKGQIETDAIAGCASMMRVKRLKKVGLSDPEFFYGPEDIEFSRRIYLGKESLIVDLDTKIYHAVTQSFRNLSQKRMYFEYKYRLLLIKKIGSFSDKCFGYSISVLKWLGYLLFALSGRHRKKIIPVGYALKDFFMSRLGSFDRKNMNNLGSFYKK